jgi:hypothetical protein
MLDVVMVVIFAQPLDLRFSNSCGSGSHHASSLLLLQYLIVLRVLHSRILGICKGAEFKAKIRKEKERHVA